MDSLKTITIYDTPIEQDEKLDAPDKKNQINDSESPNKRFKEEVYIDSSIPSILLKNIIYNCIPIESADSLPLEPNSKESAGGNTNNVSLPSVAINSPKASKKSNYILHVQFPMAILVFVQGRGFTVKAAGDTIALIGVLFDTSRSYIQTPNVFYTYKDTSIQNRALLGVLGLRSLTHRYKYPKVPRIANYYTHDILPSGTCDHNAFKNKKLAIRFLSDDDALRKIHHIQRFLLSRELHYALTFSRTLQSLSKYVITRIDFRSRLIASNPREEKISSEQNIIAELLGFPLGNRVRGNAIIYSTPLDELYISLLNKSSSPKDVAKQRELIKKHRLRYSAAEKLRSSQLSTNSMISWKEAISRREFQKPLKKLEKNELEVVETVYSRESNHANALLENKCPHNRLYRSVMASRNTMFDTQKWTKLRAMLDIPKISAATVEELSAWIQSIPNSGLNGHSAMIPCTRCKFAALCPHNFIAFEYLDKFFNGDDSACMQYILDSMTTKQNLSDGSYCRVCGELLQKVSIESESWVNLAKPNENEPLDQLQMLIVDEVAQTLNANIDVRQSSINKSNLMQSIANSISPWIRRYELKLSRVKTNTELMISFSLGLIIAIYTMMSLVHLIVLAGPSSGIKIKTIDIRGETGLKLLHTLFNGIYKLLCAQRATVIEKIIAFTPDRIKKIMTRSYGQISGAPIVIETVTVQYHTDLITDNPYYHFLKNLWRIGELMNHSNSRIPAPSEHNTVKSILGVDDDKLMELRDFFSKVKMPIKWSKYPNDKSIDDWQNYCWETQHTYANRLLNGTSELDAKNTPEITAEYNKAMKVRSALVNDLGALGRYYTSSSRNLSRSTVMKSRGYDFIIPKDLSRIFCPSGSRHDWKIYVLDNEYKINDFKSIKTKPGPFKTLKCLNCNVILNSPAKSTSVNNAIAAKTKIQGFFAYYKIRCPEGSFHIIKDRQCEKCSFKSSFNNEERNGYLEKYMASWQKSRKKPSIEIKEEIKQDESKQSQIPSYKKWVSQNEAITTASKIWPQLTYNILINIGLGSQVHFSAITASKINPSNKATDSQWLDQANTVVGYINMVTISYNKLTSCSTRGMHPDITEFCEKQSDAVRALIPIDMSAFYLEQKWRCKEDKPAGYANWTVNKLCETLLNINNGTPGMAGNSISIVKRFVEIMVDIIVESEFNMSKSVVYKNIMIAAAKSTINLSGEEIEAPETDTEAKEFIKSIVDDGEDFGAGDVDVDDFASSRGDDVI